jgi:hypothetical protein
MLDDTGGLRAHTGFGCKLRISGWHSGRKRRRLLRLGLSSQSDGACRSPGGCALQKIAAVNGILF